MKKKSVKPMRLLAFVAATACALSSTCMVNATSVPSDVSKASDLSSFVSGTSGDSSTSSSASNSSSNSTEASTTSKAPANTQSTSSAVSSSASSTPALVANPQPVYQATSVQAVPLTDIDAPANGANVTGTINVSGWALNASGIDRVDIYAYDSNGQAHSLGSVASKDLTNRGDVAQVFANAGYANINHSGYTLLVDTTQLASGTYTLAVAGIGNNSVVQWATQSIHVATPNPQTTIDAPSNGASVTGTINVSGWALNASGIDRVDMYAYDSNGQAHSLGSVASKD
ncbi:MAG: Ig-like domain-containing protein, partial [Ethanoligenens sp.]